MAIVLVVALSRFESPSGICRGAVSTANVIAELPSVEQVYLAVGTWQVSYYTQQFKLTSPKIELVPIDVSNTSLQRNGWMLSKLPRLAKQVRADFVLLSYPMPVLKPLFPRTCRLGVIVHDLYPFTNPENFGYPNVWANQGAMRLCIANVDQLVFVSRQTQRDFDRFFPDTNLPGRVVHWYAALDPTQQQRPANVPGNQRHLLMIAQHRKNKNIDLLLNALDCLQRTHRLAPDTCLYVVGSKGPETPALEKQVAQQRLGKSVYFVHSLTDPELAYLYAHCVAVVCPSSTEGFGYTIIESALFGKPVICSDISIFREVGGNHCIYFNLDAHNPTQILADALDRVLTTGALIRTQPTDAQRQHMIASYAEILNRKDRLIKA